MTTQFFLLSFLLLLSCQLSVSILITQPQPAPLETVKQWNVLTYNIPWNFPISDKNFYDAERVVATGIEILNDRIFIATPRLFSGVPATLSAIPNLSQGDSPVLQAYPNWSHHTTSRGAYNCSDIGLVSVYRMKLDSCNRLWALDAGISRSLEDYEVTCPPKILIYDTNTDQVVRRIDFPREVTRGESLFTNLIIDETTSRPENNCDDVHVYITDTVEPAIVVYDSGNDVTWRLSHPSMYPDPNFAESVIQEHRFTLLDGVVGIAFDEKAGIIYFQPLATDRVFSIATSALRAGPLPWNKMLPVKLVGKKSSQGLGIVVAPTGGSIFFSPLTEISVAKWNPTTNEQKVLAYDVERLQFAADLRITPRDPGALYILSSKFHRFFLRNLNVNEFNIRILRIEGAASDSLSPLHRQPINYQTSPALTYNYNAPVNQQVPTYTPTALLANKVTAGNPVVNPTSYVQRYFGSYRESPYNYEPVGVINKQVTSPFTSLNMGERAQFFGKPGVFQQKVNPAFNDFNGLRFVKNALYNSTVVY